MTGSVDPSQLGSPCIDGLQHGFPGQIAKVPMVGQVDDLPRLRDLAEERQNLLGTRLIESLHDVVGHEWHGLRAVANSSYPARRSAR